jgi:hypothetical protein
MNFDHIIHFHIIDTWIPLLKMEPVNYSEASANVYHTALRHILGQILHRRCKKSKSLTVLSWYTLKVLCASCLRFLEQFGWYVGWNSCSLHYNDQASTYFPSVQVVGQICMCFLFLKSITSLRPLVSDQPPKLYVGSTAVPSMPSAGNLTTTDNEPRNRFANSDVKYCRRQAASSWKLKQSPLSCICILYGSLK